MRTLPILIITLLLAGCTFNDNPNALILEGGSLSNLKGSWLMFEKGYSPGVGYIVDEVPSVPPKIITFGHDGSFTSNVEGYDTYKRYRIDKDKDDHVLVLAVSEDAFESNEAHFTIKFIDGAMFLYRRYCFEGCHEAFMKIRGNEQDQNP